MASTKITELTAANTIAVTDVLPFVSDPSGSPTTKKITANNLANSLFSNVQVSVVPYANVTYNLGSTAKAWNNVYIRALYANGALGANGTILASNGTASYWTTSALLVNVAAQYTWTNNHTFSGGVTHTGSVKSQTVSEVNWLSTATVILQYSPNTSANSSIVTDSSFVYVANAIAGMEIWSSSNTLSSTVALSPQEVTIASGGGAGCLFTNNAIFPNADNAYALGNNTYQWASISGKTITFGNFTTQNTAYKVPSGPYANDSVAATNDVLVNGLYYDSTGTVKIRLV